MVSAFRETPIHKTRFAELGYRQDGDCNWRFIDLSDNKVVGPMYPTKAELLADLDGYAAHFGCKDARPQLPTVGYCAVRRVQDSDREWLDVGTVSVIRCETESKAKKTDELIPNWAKANPVLRIATVEIMERKS